MTTEQDQPSQPQGEPLIGKENIADAVQTAAEKEPADAPDVLAGEPLLSSYLRDGVLQMLGKLALAGAGHAIIESTAEDMFRLLSVAAGSVRNAYRALLNDLVPDPGAGTTDEEPGDTPPGRGAGGPTN